MGLNEKRLAKEIKENKFPAFEKQLNDLFPVKTTVDWDSFAAYDEWPLNRMEEYLFTPLTEAFTKITSDDIGKEALKEKITEINLKCTDKDEDQKLELKDKTLYYVVQLASLGGGAGGFSSHGEDGIRRYIENLL
jgi:hypothetical protein